MESGSSCIILCVGHMFAAFLCQIIYFVCAKDMACNTKENYIPYVIAGMQEINLYLYSLKSIHGIFVEPRVYDSIKIRYPIFLSIIVYAFTAKKEVEISTSLVEKSHFIPFPPWWICVCLSFTPI